LQHFLRPSGTPKTHTLATWRSYGGLLLLASRPYGGLLGMVKCRKKGRRANDGATPGELPTTAAHMLAHGHTVAEGEPPTPGVLHPCRCELRVAASRTPRTRSRLCSRPGAELLSPSMAGGPATPASARGHGGE
jgi:hypothetical protein